MAVLKVIEVLSSSTVSWEDATRKAVAQAAKSLKNIRSVYVQDQSASVKDTLFKGCDINWSLLLLALH